MKNIKHFLVSFLLIISTYVSILYFSYDFIDSISANSTEVLKVTYPKIDNTGDCALVQFGSIDILIDSGAVNSIDDLKKFISDSVIDGHLEYIFVTHGDTDHIKHFATLFNTFFVSQSTKKTLDSTSTAESTISVGEIIDFANVYEGSPGYIYNLYNPDNTNNNFQKYITNRNELIGVNQVTSTTKVSDSDYGIYDSVEIEGNVKYSSIAKKISEDGVEIKIQDGGKEATIHLIDNIFYRETLNVLDSIAKNVLSICLMIQYEKSKFLTTGDIGDYTHYSGSNSSNGAEAQLYENDTKNILKDITLYKAAHHGSKSSNSEEFMDHITPKNIMLTCIGGGQYNFPSNVSLDNFLKYTDYIYMSQTYKATNASAQLEEENTDGEDNNDETSTANREQFDGEVVFLLKENGDCDTQTSEKNYDGILSREWYKENRVQSLNTYVFNSGKNDFSSCTLVKIGHFDILINCGNFDNSFIENELKKFIVDGVIEYLIVTDYQTYTMDLIKDTSTDNFFVENYIDSGGKTNAEVYKNSLQFLRDSTNYIDGSKLTTPIVITNQLTLNVLQNSASNNQYSLCFTLDYFNDKLLFVGNTRSDDLVALKSVTSNITFFLASKDGTSDYYDSSFVKHINAWFIAINNNKDDLEREYNIGENARGNIFNTLKFDDECYGVRFKITISSQSDNENSMKNISNFKMRSIL